MADHTKTLRTLSCVKQFSQRCIAPSADSLFRHIFCAEPTSAVQREMPADDLFPTIVRIGRSELIDEENFFGLAQQSSTEICALQRTRWRACHYLSGDELRISAHRRQGDKQ